MSEDIDYERITNIVIDHEMNTDTEIRIFLNELCNTHEYLESEETIKYYYCFDDVPLKVYNRLSNEPNLRGGLSYYIFLNPKKSVTSTLVYSLRAMYTTLGYCTIYLHQNVISINGLNGIYISVSSTDSDTDALKDDHIARVRYLLSILNDMGIKYAYECRTLSDMHITSDEECEI